MVSIVVNVVAGHSVSKCSVS